MIGPAGHARKPLLSALYVFGDALAVGGFHNDGLHREAIVAQIFDACGQPEAPVKLQRLHRRDGQPTVEVGFDLS